MAEVFGLSSFSRPILLIRPLNSLLLVKTVTIVSFSASPLPYIIPSVHYDVFSYATPFEGGNWIQL